MLQSTIISISNVTSTAAKPSKKIAPPRWPNGVNFRHKPGITRPILRPVRIGLTAPHVGHTATCVIEKNDDNEGQETTRAYLQRALACADNAIACLIGGKADVPG